MKTRTIEHKRAFARRGQYENALTKSSVKNRPIELSYAEMELGEEVGQDGTTRSVKSAVYFRDVPGNVALKLRDDSMPVGEKLQLMMQLLAKCVVDPTTAEPIMTEEEWGEEDFGFINKVAGAVLGVQVIAMEDGEEEGETGEKSDQQQESEDGSNGSTDPNPLDVTDGSGSHTSST